MSLCSRTSLAQETLKGRHLILQPADPPSIRCWGKGGDTCPEMLYNAFRGGDFRSSHSPSLLEVAGGDSGKQGPSLKPSVLPGGL